VGGGEGANRGNWGGSFKDDQRGRVRGSPATLSQDVRGGELGGGRSPGYGADARGTPASVLLGSAQASPYGASSVQGGSPGDYGGGGGGVMSVGARSVGGTTPQSAAQLQQTASQMSHKQQDLFGALPASKRRESSRGQGRGGGSSSDRGGGGGADVREYRKASDASASPESLIPQVGNPQTNGILPHFSICLSRAFSGCLFPRLSLQKPPFVLEHHSSVLLKHRCRPSLLLGILFRQFLGRWAPCAIAKTLTPGP
jgi:hypothetical protein